MSARRGCAGADGIGEVDWGGGWLGIPLLLLLHLHHV